MIACMILNNINGMIQLPGNKLCNTSPLVHFLTSLSFIMIDENDICPPKQHHFS